MVNNEPGQSIESLDDLLQGKHVHVEVMLNAVKGNGKDGTVLYSGTYAGRARLGSMEFIILTDNAAYFTPANVWWTDKDEKTGKEEQSPKVTSDHLYVALDRVISIADGRKKPE